MVASEHPVTMPELRDELRVLRNELQEHYATKADLSDLKATLRGDINKLTVAVAGLQLLGLGAVAAIMQFLG